MVMQSAEVVEERVEGILVSRVDAASVDAAIETYSVKVKKSEAKTLAGKLTALAKHLVAEENLVQCDICDGVSSGDLKACPYCNDGKPLKADDLGPEAVLIDRGDILTEEVVEALVQDEVEGTEFIESPAEILEGAATYEEEPEKKKVNRPSRVAKELARLEGTTTLQSQTTLDEAVAEVHRHVREDKANGWKLGTALFGIFEGQLWSLRQTKDGAPAYKTWDQFLASEVPAITTRYAWVLMKVAHAYTEEQFVESGPKKLYATLAVDDADIRKHLLKKAEGGATVRELIDEGRKAKKNSGKKHAKDHSATQKQKTGEKAGAAGKITVATVLGRHSVPLYAKGGDKKLAKTVDEGPWGFVDLVNDVRAHFAVTRDTKGHLRLNVNIKRVE